MKKNLTNTILSRLCLVALLLSTSFKGYSAAHLNMTITNCSTTGNEIQFDFMLQNDGDQSMKLNSGSFRLIHDAAIIPAGNNEFTFTYVSGTTDFPKAFVSRPSNYNLNYNAASRLMQLTMSTANYSEATAVTLPVGKEMKVGRFALKIVNNNFVPGAEVNTSFFPSGNGAVVYNNGSSKSEAMAQTWAIAEGSEVSGPVRDLQLTSNTSVSRMSNASLVTSANYAGKPYAVSSLSINVKSTCRIAGEKSKVVAGDFIAYPNPTSGKATVSFTSDRAAKYALKVFDMIGNTLILQNISAVEGYNTADLNLEKYAKGMYFVSIQTEGSNPKTMQIVVE